MSPSDQSLRCEKPADIIVRGLFMLRKQVYTLILKLYETDIIQFNYD